MFGKVGALVAGGELHVGPCPSAGPVVFAIEPVECGAALPVVPGQVEGVLDAQAALFGAVDEEDAAERPVRLTTEIGLVLLVDDGHLLAAAGQFVGGHQAREASADHDDVSIHRTSSRTIGYYIEYINVSDIL